MVLRGIVLAATLLAAVLFANGAEAQEADLSGPANRAFADAAATTEVSGQAKAAMVALFSYRWSDIGKWEESVETWATGDAARKIASQMSANLTTITQQKVTMTSTVVALGVHNLRDGQAQVVVFLNSRTERRSVSPAVTGSSAVVSLRRGPQRWQVVDIEVPQ